jgi:hypothetical protein
LVSLKVPSEATVVERGFHGTAVDRVAAISRTEPFSGEPEASNAAPDTVCCARASATAHVSRRIIARAPLGTVMSVRRRDIARNNFPSSVSEDQTAMRRLVSKVVFLGLLSSTLFAQPAADPSFEVASVKSNRTEDPATTLFPLGPGDAYAANGGRFRATNQPLITYLRFAYRLGPGDLLDLRDGSTTSDSTSRRGRTASRPRIRCV